MSMNRMYCTAMLLGLMCCFLVYAASEKKLQEPSEANSDAHILTTEQNKDDDIYTIDMIKVVIFGEERTDIITQSDTEKPSLDGHKRSQEDLILERLMYQDAARYKMLPNEDAIDKRLHAVQRENNLSQDDLKNIFRASGYTYQEGRELFAIMTAVGTVLDFKIMSRLIVPEKDIIAYYQEHPVMQEPTFQLERALVIHPDHWSADKFKTELQSLVELKPSCLEVEWSNPFWVNKSDIAANRQFITSMEVNTISIAEESAAGVELIKLVNKKDEHLMTLEERYHEIADLLKRPKYEEMFKAYKQELFNNAALLYL